MKKANFILLSVGLMLSATITSCKDKDDPIPAASKKEYLIGKKWKEVARTISPAYAGETDAYAEDPACQRDDFHQYAADGTYTFDEGTTKCDEDSPQTQKGTWALSADEKTLTIIGGGQTYVYPIVNLTASELKYNWSATIDGASYTITRTYEAQQ